MLDESQEGWRPLVSSSAIAFSKDSPVPEALTLEGIQEVIDAFAQAAKRSLKAGFKWKSILPTVILLHQFLSPLSNVTCV